MTSAVTEASQRECVSLGILGEEFQKRTAFPLLFEPSPHCGGVEGTGRPKRSVSVRVLRPAAWKRFR